MSYDSDSMKRLNALYPDVMTRAIHLFNSVYKATGLSIRITEGIRTMERQAELYAQGRTEPGPIVTNSRAGESIHHYGLAFDICIRGSDPFLENYRKQNGQKAFDDLWRRIGKIGLGEGLTWGFDWNGNGIVDGNDFDRPHFQITYGMRMQEIRELYRVNGLAAVWAQADSIRGVPQGSEWDDLLSKKDLAEVGQIK